MRDQTQVTQRVILAGTVVLVCSATGPSVWAGRLVAWGWNEYGQCDVPAGDDYVAISAQFKHSLALKADGTVVGWGQNNHGQSDPPPGNDHVAVAAGELHSLALRSDGSIVAWGYNRSGQCDVPAGNDFVAIAGGHDHSLALRSDGTVVAWGNNDDGQCDVPAGNDYVAISAGFSYSLGLTSDRRIVAWGKTDSPFVTFRVPSGTDFQAIAAGGFLRIHALALRADGSVVAWGDNTYGQSAVPAGNNYVTIAAGADHSLALRNDGSIVGWGDNDHGESATGDIKGVIAIAAGASHSVALLGLPDSLTPIADAGPDMVAAANEEVLLDASGSSDPDGEIVEYTWRRLPDDIVIYSGPQPKCTTKALGRAEELIELTVTDNDLLQSTDTVVIINVLLDSRYE